MDSTEWANMWTRIEEMAAHQEQLREALLNPETGRIKKDKNIQRALELLFRKASKGISRSDCRSKVPTAATLT